MSLLCAYCLKRPRLGGFVRPTSPAGPWILIGTERLPAGMAYCAEHPVALLERCRCGAEHFRGTTSLVGPGVALLVQPGWQRLGEAEVQERFDVRPSQMVDLLALQGDASDEVPGCPGVGAKTALALLQEFGSVAGIYKNPWKVKLLPGLRGAGQVAQRLAAGEASVRLSHQLAQLDRAVPGLPGIAALRWIPDRRRARQIQAVCEDLGIPTHTQGLVALQDGWGAAPHKEHAL